MVTPRRGRDWLLIGGLTMALSGSACDGGGGARAAEPPPRSGRKPPDNPPELGHVSWRSDYHAALDEAKKTGKPVLVLFDEVPGCSTVNAFGRDVLTDRRVVEAADTLFISVVVYNNKDGEHRQVLEHWNEPAWNNPVMRFIDGHLKALAPRLTHGAGTSGVLKAMASALLAAKKPVPDWLASAAR
jgi:hypothetical protein